MSLYNSSETVQVDMPSTIQVLKSVKTQLRYLPHQQTVPEGKKQTIGNNIKLTWCIEHLRFCNDWPFSQLNPQIIIQNLPWHSGTSSATGFKHLDNGHLALLSFTKGKSTSLTISYRQEGSLFLILETRRNKERTYNQIKLQDLTLSSKSKYVYNCRIPTFSTKNSGRKGIKA